MAETLEEDFHGLYLLACVCAQEAEEVAQKSQHPLLPIDFPKKQRSLRRPKRFHKPQSSPLVQSDGDFGSNMKISATVLGKRCYFEADHQVNHRKKQRKMTNGQEGGLNRNLQTQLPTNFVDHIKAMGGSDVKLVIEKKITKTDLAKGNNRISMPLTQILSEFLTEDEKESLTRMKEDGKHRMGIDVMLLDPFLDGTTKLCLKRWDFNNNSSCYMLIENWFDVAMKNGLRANMNVQMWSFRLNSNLYFAMVY